MKRLALALLALLAATPEAIAREIATAAQQLLTTCDRFGSGAADATAAAEAEGWAFQPPRQQGGFVSATFGQRAIDGVGTAQITVITQTYPVSVLTSCRIDISKPLSNVEIGSLGERSGLTGAFVGTDRGGDGTWHDANLEAGEQYLLTASQTGPSILLILTTIRKTAN